MKLKRKVLPILCVGLLLVSFLTGCSNSSNSDNSSSGNSNSTKDYSGQTIYVKVQSVSDKTITGVVGTLNMQGGGQGTGQGDSQNLGTPPAQGDSQNLATPPAQGDSSNSTGSGDSSATPPALPDNNSGTGDTNNGGGTAPNGTAPDGAAPGGDSTNGSAPGGNGQNMPSPFTESDETITFTITDSTKISVQSMQNTADGTISDITTDSILAVTFDTSKAVTTVVVNSFGFGGGTAPGGDSANGSAPGGNFGGSSTVTNGTAATTLDSDQTVARNSYSSTGDDENALRVDGATVTLDGITVDKTSGNSSNTENGDFYGQNAGLLVLNGATATIKNSTFTTSVTNGNGVFSYGEGTTVNISDSKITTTGNNSGGIQTTGGGTTNASNLTVNTSGNSAASIRSDRGGGTVTVDGGTYTTNGTGSPSIYSTANISVKNATLTANNSEAVVVEGKNSVSLTDCNVTGNMTSSTNNDSSDNIHNIMIYQSMSGDAEVGHASFSMAGGSLTSKVGDMIYVTNTSCDIALSNVALTLSNENLLNVAGNSSSRGWGTEGANGGKVTFTGTSQTMSGNILVDKISTLDMTLSSNSAYTGSINPTGAAGEVNVTLDASSTWTLTADSYITSFTGDSANINLDGHTLYVNGTAFAK